MLERILQSGPVLRHALAGMLLAVLWAAPLRAEEVISRFDSRIDIASNGDLTVKETIRVQAEGNQIKRGIFRDIPLVFEDAGGRLRDVGFDLVSVKRDGRDEPYFTEFADRFVRIYIGDRDVLIDHGPHTYEIVYTTDRQIRFFEAYDELFWNATGNGWDFPILAATATVMLPPGARAQETVYFTGPQGARDKAATAVLEDNGNRAVFTSTAPLAAREGLTVGVKLAKGVIAKPDSVQEASWFWRDHGGSILAAATLALVFVYYFWAWRRVGRDPPKGVVVPRWDAPGGISPALTAYIDKKGFAGQGMTALSAAALNLAVNGYVTLDNLSGDLAILATGKAPETALPVGEAAVLKKVSETGRITVAKSHSAKVQALQRAFVQSVEKEHRSEFYKANTGWIVAGILLSALGLFAILGFGNVDADTLASLLPALIGGCVFVVIAANFGKSLFRPTGLAGKIRAVLVLGLLVIVFVPTVLLQAAALVFEPSEPVLGASVAGIFMVNFLFFFLLGAPTPIGRKMMDGIEGLRTYLQLAEKDRMNLAGAPSMSPSHFETLLPYAVALGVEKPWSKAFQTWLASAAAQSAAYVPGWQHGFSSSGRDIGDAMASIGDSMSSSFTASMPAPKSSSSGFSGGGGSSGGGGGGGGGGGW